MSYSLVFIFYFSFSFSCISFSFLNLFILYYFFIFIFIIGINGIFLSYRNIILFLISLELKFVSLGIYTLLSSFFLDDGIGYFIFLFILFIAAIDSAIGLTLLTVYYRKQGIISMESIQLLRS
jgi:NADH-quinone oxidoreductase subunit K